MFYFFYLGQVAIKLYWVMVGLALGLGFIPFYFEAKRRDLEKKQIFSFYLLGLLTVLIGARLFHLLLTKPKIFFQEPAKVFSLSDIYWGGGVSIYGGVLGGLLFTLWFCRKNRISFRKLADAITPSIILGTTLIRLGCFLNGCCYGKPTKLPWAVVFHNHLINAPLGIPLHPVQLYEAGGNLLLFFYFWKERKKMRFSGELALKYCFSYNLLRIFTEFFKHPAFRYKNTPFTSSQIFALGFLIFALVMLKTLSRK